MGCNCGKKRIYFTALDSSNAADMRDYVIEKHGKEVNPIRVSGMYDYRGMPRGSTVYTYELTLHPEFDLAIRNYVFGRGINFIKVTEAELNPQ